MGAVAARGTVEMLSAPERVKVSTDVPSQPLSVLGTIFAIKGALMDIHVTITNTKVLFCND